ncbi:MAG: hypothetical protein IIA61_09000 [Candidatus Marinimicrobia bacterium]|nr:hypothetical protein [Candidatus Neomarinimicrobiota bacterium]
MKTKILQTIIISVFLFNHLSTEININGWVVYKKYNPMETVLVQYLRDGIVLDEDSTSVYGISHFSVPDLGINEYME